MKLDSDDKKLELIRLQHQGLNYNKIASELGLAASSVRRFLTKETHKDWWEKNGDVASGKVTNHHTNIKKLDGKRFVFTSAQNNTYVNSAFLKSLETYCEHNNAELIVGTFSYNKSGFQNLGKGEADWFDPKIEKYILDEPAIIFDKLLWLGELNILPTAVNPLSGYHNYTKLDSAIIPHTKVQLESVPTYGETDTKILYTTGAITLQNYIQKSAGQKASFHHVFGALVAEQHVNGLWFVRQLNADSEGGFYDLTNYYSNSDISEYNNVEAINYGDLHCEKEDVAIFDASFRSYESMVDVLRPSYQIANDILDFEARNHHTINDPYHRFISFTKDKDSVKSNIDKVGKTLTEMDREYSDIVIVESNHDLALERWLKSSDYKIDPQNAVTFLKLQLYMYECMEKGIEPNLLKYSLNTISNINTSYIKFLKVDESFTICGDIECGSHGHLGNNGGRGSVLSHTKLGSRFNIGHTHSASIKDGVYCAGVSASLKMGYNKGGSSWSNSSIVTYENGKRTIVTMKKDKHTGKAFWKA